IIAASPRRSASRQLDPRRRRRFHGRMRPILCAFAFAIGVFACAGTPQQATPVTSDQDMAIIPDLTPRPDLQPARPSLLGVSPPDVKVNVGSTFSIKVTLSAPWFGQTPLVVKIKPSDAAVLTSLAEVTFAFND